MSTPTLNSDAVWLALAQIMDPEFGVSIVDLGLIYSVECTDGDVRVVMTLTTSSCPAGAWIHDGVRTALRQLDGAKETRAELVFEPLWNPSMLTAEGRRQLGWSTEDSG